MSLFKENIFSVQIIFAIAILHLCLLGFSQEEQNIKFERSIKVNKTIRLDKSKFIRVFNNMFKNSIEAMPYGGKITVIAEEDKNEISIKIIDTGIGIPEEKINNLFRPFQTTKAKGLGLGLNFCKNTVEAHGGKINVESKIGKGTTFTIILPLDIEDYELNQSQNIIKIKDSLIK